MNNDIEPIVSIMYQAGNWSIAQVRSLVGPDGITPEQFTEITGQPYEVKTTSQPTSPVATQNMG